MSGSNYAFCPGCNTKALYVGDDTLDGREVWHDKCWAKHDAEVRAPLEAEVERLLGEVEPMPCEMRRQPPMDFAYCETHDTTFPLGDACKFQGRQAWEVYAEEADEQRRRAVMAEMAHEAAEAKVRAAHMLADEWERTEAYTCVNPAECSRCLAYQSAVIRLRAALADPTPERP